MLYPSSHQYILTSQGPAFPPEKHKIKDSQSNTSGWHPWSGTTPKAQPLAPFFYFWEVVKTCALASLSIGAQTRWLSCGRGTCYLFPTSPLSPPAGSDGNAVAVSARLHHLQPCRCVSMRSCSWNGVRAVAPLEQARDALIYEAPSGRSVPLQGQTEIHLQHVISPLCGLSLQP